jgi:hypothetical protein
VSEDPYWLNPRRHRWWKDGLVWTVICAVMIGAIVALAISQIVTDLR